MHEDDGAGVARNRDGERFIDIFGDAALEEAVSTVREQVVPVAARDNLEAAVFDCGVVEVEQDAYRAAVGQRVVGEVLVLFDGGADTGRFHVDLGVVVDQVGAEQRLDGVEQLLGVGELAE